MANTHLFSIVSFFIGVFQSLTCSVHVYIR